MTADDAENMEAIKLIHASFAHAAGELEALGHTNDYLRRGAVVDWLRSPVTAAGKLLHDLMTEVEAVK